jgi:hypothetical protein
MPMHNQWTGKAKRAYTTREEAVVACDKFSDDTGHLMNVYQCWCKSWHIGHPGVPHKVRASERRTVAVEEALVGKLIAALKGVING